MPCTAGIQCRTFLRDRSLSFRSAQHFFAFTTRIPYKSDLHFIAQQSLQTNSDTSDTKTRALPRGGWVFPKRIVFALEVALATAKFAACWFPRTIPSIPGPMATLSTLTPLSTDHHSFFLVLLRVLSRGFEDFFPECWAVHRPTTWSNRLAFEIFCSFGIRKSIERATALSSRGTGYKSAQQTPQ